MNTLPSDRIASWLIDARFDIAHRMLRRALEAEHLRVSLELDVKQQLRHELGISLRECLLLWADDPLRLLEATAINPAGALFVPEPIVLSENGSKSRASIRSLPAAALTDLPASLRGAVVGLHAQVVAALERAGSKESAVTALPEYAAIA